jgi:hypothetical protein
MAAVESRIQSLGPARGTPGVLLLIILGLYAVFAAVSVASPQWVPMAAFVAAIAISAFVLLYPEMALRLSFFLMLVAMTKFRARDATALLSGAFDEQIIFELLCYALALLVITVNLLPAFGRYARRFTRTERLLGAYVLLAVASIWWSANVQITAGRAIQLAILYVLCAIAVRRLGPGPTLRTFLASVASYALLATGLAVLFPWARHPGPLFSWFAIHPADTGTLAGSAAMIMIASAIYAPDAWRDPLKRFALWAAIATCVAVLLGAHSRTPLFAFVAGTGVLWMRRRLGPWTAGLALAGMLVFAGVGLRSLAESYADAAPTSGYGNPVAVYLLRGHSGQEFLGLSGRAELWNYESSLIREQPLIGHGYVASRSLLLARFPWAGTSHGALPEAVLSLGILGAALLSAIVVRIFVSAFVRADTRDAPDAWGHAVVLGGCVFLIVLAVGGDSFAGPPGYEVLLFFAAAMAHEHLASAKGPGQ